VLRVELDNGELDSVAGLFSNEGIDTFDVDFDRHKILVGVDKIAGTYRDQNCIVVIDCIRYLWY
jgi:hypothetical protein